MIKRIIIQSTFVVLLILFLASLPTTIKMDVSNQTVEWNGSALLQSFSHFLQEILKGGLGTYEVGLSRREIAQDLPDNFFTSLIILTISVHTAFLLSLLLAVFLQRSIISKIVKSILHFFSIIPDFMFIILLLLLAVKWYKLTGVRVISLRPDTGPINLWFPIVLISLAPMLYLFKQISWKYEQIKKEDYIRTAVSKGLNESHIILHHIMKNLDPFIRSHLPKVVSLAIGQLFIVEYLLNVTGMTKFIFLSSEFHPIAVGLLGIVILALLVYFSLRLILYFFIRGFLYD